MTMKSFCTVFNSVKYSHICVFVYVYVCKKSDVYNPTRCRQIYAMTVGKPSVPNSNVEQQGKVLRF